MRDQVIELIIGAGVMAMQALLAESVIELCGESFARRAAEQFLLWRRQKGDLVLGKREVRIQRRCAREAGREVPIPANLDLQAKDLLKERAAGQMPLGVSTCKRRRLIEVFAGLEIRLMVRIASGTLFTSAALVMGALLGIGVIVDTQGVPLFLA